MTGKASVSMQGLRSARGILTGLCVHFWMSFIGLKVFLYWFVMTFFLMMLIKFFPWIQRYLISPSSASLCLPTPCLLLLLRPESSGRHNCLSPRTRTAPGLRGSRPRQQPRGAALIQIINTATNNNSTVKRLPQGSAARAVPGVI